MSATVSFKAQAATQGCNWLFTDPYAYQYSEITGNAASSNQYELQDSKPDNKVSRAVDVTSGELVELEGSPGPSFSAPVLYAFDSNWDPLPEPSNNSRLKKSSSVLRNRFASVRASLKHPQRRGDLPAHSELPEVVSEAEPTDHAYFSGMMPVEESQESSTPSRYTGSVSPETAGLISADESSSTPTTPALDFDTILKNIGPMSKKRRYCGPSRASRYYDRYSTNQG